MRYSVRNLSYTTSHPDFRWDGEYLCFEPYKNPNLKYVPIGDALLSSQYGISVEMNEEGDGNKIYRMNEIHNMLCDREVTKYARVSSDDIKLYKLKDRDVLFNRTNSQTFVGRNGVFKKYSDEDIVFASYLVRVNPDPNVVTPEYLVAFLNTKYGDLDVKRRARISINQSPVNPEELKRVEIPWLGSDFQEKITLAFDRAFNFVQNAETKHKEAQALLLTELGLANWQPKHRLTFIKNSNEVMNVERFDAEHFQPKYDEVMEAVNKNSSYTKKIAEIQIRNSRGLQPEYIEGGSIDVITSKHILEDGLAYDDFEKTTQKYWDEQKRARIKTGDILTYTTGANIGRTAMYSSERKALASNHVNILTIKDESPDYVAFVMNSTVDVK